MSVSGNSQGNNGGRMYSNAATPSLIDCNFIVDATNANGRGIRSLKGQGVADVFMHTSATPGVGPSGYLNPNPASGYALVRLSSNYNRYLGGFSGMVSPLSGSNIGITASGAALTIGTPYVITSVGAGPAGTVTIAPVADVAGSLASKYFVLYDAYGNTFAIYFVVSGVGVAPLLGQAAPFGKAGLHYVKQAITSGDSAATIGAALVLTINNLPSGVNGVFSFTSSGTTTVTAVSTVASPVAGIPMDGSIVIPDSGPSIPIIFTVTSANATAGAIYTDGSGHLYNVSTTLVAGTSLVTSGIGSPLGATLTKVSGTGDASITFSSAAAGYATGFSFAQTVKDTNLQDWNAVGVPKGVTPAVGVSFIAIATGAGASTGLVKVAGVSGIASVEVIGDPNLSFAPQTQGGSANIGAWLLIQFLAATSSSVTTQIATAPAAGSTVGLSFYVDARLSPSNINSR